MLRALTPLLLAPVLACGASSGETQTGADTSTATSTASSTDASSDDASSDTPTTRATDPATTDPSTDPTTTTTDPTTTSASADSSTGEPAFCNGWEGADGEPWLELHDRTGVLLADGGALPLECGGQGLFMFGLYAHFGGFTPMGDIIDFAVTVDVDGFNTNPDGHFYSADPVGYYVSCEPVVGAPLGVVPVFPLDNLDDLTALDGKSAAVHVVMRTGGPEVTLDLDLVLSVQKDDSWGFCGG